LAIEDSPVFLPPAWDVPVSMWFDEDETIEAFRTGRGVGWDDHNGRLYDGVAAFYRNAYQSHLVSDWLPALETAMQKLLSGAKVADIGCGHGHSAIIMAEAFPKSRFWGFDSHADSIAAARCNAYERGVGNRVTFTLADARSYNSNGFDLICFFDCLHDMGDPVAAARHARESLSDEGSVMLVEPFANDRVEDNLNPIGRLYYAASTTLCCAHSLSEEGGLALGAQAGEKKLAGVFKKAGFRTFRSVKKTPFNLILEARP